MSTQRAEKKAKEIGDESEQMGSSRRPCPPLLACLLVWPLGVQGVGLEQESLSGALVCRGR